MVDPLRPLVLPILALLWSAWLDRGRVAVVAYLLEENRVLREQLGRRGVRFTDPQRGRLARAAKEIPRHVLMRQPTIVTPDTLLRWFRKLVAAKYDSSDRRAPGRPRTRADLRQLVVQMATDNPTWGYTRMRGALLNVGHDLSCSTIARILRGGGISPTPERQRCTTWRQFLRSHADAIAATDFFTVEVMTAVGVVRHFVLFVIELKTRRVEVFGITRDPCETWMRVVARGATDAVDGCLRSMRYLLHDRDPLFCCSFRELLAGSGVKCVRLPARSPNLNAYAERFVGSVRRECLDRVIPLGERHLRRLVAQYVRHYNTERNHQGIESRLIEPTIAANDGVGTIQCRERLGGLLRFYHREAA